jgi:hypothetical protein
MEDNKMIAEFMGFTLDTPTNIEGEVWYDNEEVYLHISSEFKHSNCFKELQFHKSWDWLMPVVENIESLGYSYDRINADVFINTQEGENVIPNPMDGNIMTMLQKTYKAVVVFIKWYNKNN